MKLRLYQNQVIKETYQFFKLGLKSVLVYAPTGAGKTVMASQMIADAVNKGRRVLFLVHRTKLAFQTVSTLKKAYDLDAGIIWADYPKTPDAKVQIAMIQTLQNRDLPKDIGLVVLDEAHTTSYYKIVQKVFTTYSGGVFPLSPCYFLGLSGSPWRAKSKEGFCQFFQAIVRAPNPERLIQMGHLVHARHFGWNGLIDFSQLDIGSSGEYTEKSMRKVCNSDLNAEIVKQFMEHCPGRKPIAFCGSVQQAYDLSLQFNDAGVVAETVVGETSEDTRDHIYTRFSSGQTQLLSSVGCLTEGFDETSCDAVVLARPIASLPLLVQMCGRALRLHEGKVDALLLDFCENFKRLGLVTKAHPISLCPKDKPVFIPTKECPQCHASISTFSKICPECGYEFEGEGEGDESPRQEPNIEPASIIVLSTIHRAKGDEAERVFLLGSNNLPFSYKNQPAWQREQELNLIYVALTRSKKNLFFVPTPTSLLNLPEQLLALPFRGINFPESKTSTTQEQPEHLEHPTKTAAPTKEEDSLVGYSATFVLDGKEYGGIVECDRGYGSLKALEIRVGARIYVVSIARVQSVCLRVLE